MKKIKVMTIFGTRPEAIKMAPLVLELKRQSSLFEPIVTITAQHREMLDQVLNIFDITPDYDLNIMTSNQTLSQITSKVILGLEEVMKETKPDIVLVHGDTTTTFGASIAAFYQKIKIGHVEAGLRTFNKYSPYPEEMNRQLTDVLTDIYFAPTFNSKKNLLQENYSEEKIYVTGNTAIDSLKSTVIENYQHPVLNNIKNDNRLILATMHRRENIGEPMERVFKAMRAVVESHVDVEVVYPVHLNPLVQKAAHKYLSDHERIHLIDPLEVTDFHNIAARSFMIMSDSGGVQEEAPSLGVPVLVLRDTTERPEGVEANTLRLVGTETEDVLSNMIDLLDNHDNYLKMAKSSNPYGDGNASKRILEAIAYEFSLNQNRPEDYTI